MSYNVQKPCRICGKMYTPCPDCEHDNTAFHWRTVACSIECGREYFKRVIENRKIQTVFNNDIEKNMDKNKETETTATLSKVQDDSTVRDNGQAKNKNSLKKTDLNKNKDESEQIG